MTLNAELLARNTDRCRTCRAEILWATTPPKGDVAGKPIPVDPAPVYGGNLLLELDAVGMLQARYVKAAGDVEAYVAHFASCPQAQQHRAKPKGHEEQAQERGQAGREVMPFGKFSGEYLDDIAASSRGHAYLVWAYENLEFRQDKLKRAIGVVIGRGEA
jgi:uncharacterized protein (DUF3820 family)